MTALSTTTGLADRLVDPFRESGDMEQAVFDAAIIANRRTTPQAAIDKRTAPRYSIGELNAMDWDQVRERFNRLPKPDTRPGIVKFLDIIDLPRNAIANGITAIALPKARQAAIERGDFDDAGFPKVWGSDILRGMGIDNRIVNGVVGFGLDIAMDPLSWVGGPIGGLKNTGAKGAYVTFGKTGERAIMGGLKALKAGKPTADEAVGGYLKAKAAQYGIDIATDPEASSKIATRMFGDVGGAVRNLGSKAGLGVKGSGGDLADDIWMAASDAVDDLHRASIIAAKKVAEKYTLNKKFLGLQIGKDLPENVGSLPKGEFAAALKPSPGTAYAHFPLTDITLYGPAFTRAGHDAVMQRAVALTVTGKAAAGAVLADLQTTFTNIGRISEEIDKIHLLNKNIAEAERHEPLVPSFNRRAMSEPGEDVSGYAAARALGEERINALETDLKALRERSKQFRNDVQSGAIELAAPENLGDILASAHLSSKIELQAKMAGEARLWRDVEQLIPRPIREDVATARAVRFALARRSAQDGVTTVRRTEEPNVVTQRPSAKPHGLYLAKQGSDLGSDLGGKTKHYAFEPRNPLDVSDTPINVVHERTRSAGPGGSPASAGIRALRKMVGEEEFSRLASLKRPELNDMFVAVAPKVKWDQYHDAYEMLEGYAGILARQKGYDAIVGDADEVVALADSVIVPLKKATDPATIFDETAPMGRRVQEFDKAAREYEEVERARHAGLVTFRDREMKTAESVADAFQQYVDTANELALFSDVPLGRLIQREDRELFRAANRLMRIDDDTAGAIRMGRFFHAARLIDNPSNAASALAALGTDLTKRFGVPDSMMTRMVNRLIATTNGYPGDAARTLTHNAIYGGGPFSKGIRTIAKDHGLPPSAQDDVLTMAYALQTARAQGASGSGFWRTLVDGSDTALTRRVNKPGIKELFKNADLMNDLEKFADEAGTLLHGQGDIALREGYLHTLGVGGTYLPTRAIDEMAERIRLLKDKSGAVGSATSKEAFQKPRELVEIRFKDNDGNMHSFLELERTLYGHLTDDVLDGMEARHPPEKIAPIRKAVEEIRLFDQVHKGVDDIARTHVFGKPLDAFELNEKIDSGVLHAIAGGPLINREVFQTNIIDLLATHASERMAADAKAAFVEGVIKPFVIAGDTLVAAGERFVTGNTFKLADGREATVLDKNRVRIGSTVYRELPTDKSGKAVLNLRDLMVDDGKVYKPFVPEAIAELVDKFHKAMEPRNLDTVFKAADAVTRAWKVSTLSHLSWMVVNAIGNAIMLTMAYGPQFKRLPAILKFATLAAIHKDDPAYLAKMSIELGGRNISGADIIGVSGPERMIGGGMSMEGIRHTFPDPNKPSTGTAPPKFLDPRPMVGNVGSRIKQEYVDALSESAISRQDARIPDYINRSSRRLQASGRAFWRGGLRPAVNAWFAVNGGIDDSFRLAAFMLELDRGSDVSEAAAAVRRNMLNFGDLTKFESEKIRPWFPFYSWVRASVGGYLPRLISDPKQFSALPKLQEALEELGAGEGQIPRHMRPRWIQEQLGIQVGHNPETRKAVTIGTMLPQEQAIRVGTGLAGVAGFFTPGKQKFGGQELMDFLDFTWSQANPILKGGVDLATGREGFTGRQIGPEGGFGDLSASEYMLKQVRWFNELGVGSSRTGPLLRSFDEGLGVGASRLLIGGRLQPIDDERVRFSLMRDMRAKEDGVRRAIRIAQREGNQPAELNARVKLLEVYREHLFAGGSEEDIPKWAVEQIGQLEATAGAGP